MVQFQMQDSSPPPNYQHYNHLSEEDELSLIDLWNIVWRRKWAWLTFGPLFGIIGMFYALAQPILFRAETTLAPADEEQSSGGLSALAGQFGGLASLAGVSIPGGGSVENAIATLKSRRFLIPFLTKDENLKTLFMDDWDTESKSWITPSDRRTDSNRPTDLEAYEKFTDGILSVSEDKKTGLVNVSIELRNPEIASKWANEIVEALNAHLREQAQAEAQANLEFLNTQLKQTSIIEIREALYGLIESQTKNAMLANAKEDYAFKVIDPAVTPEVRSKPKRSLIVIASGLLGGFFGIFLCFALHLVDTAKRGGEEKVS
ncbi:MAG: hypothetical protein F6K47_36710 [Symploca sp. SIO2E6]|nr:hypothetical protein [Symploca sp. SIO2E6]